MHIKHLLLSSFASVTMAIAAFPALAQDDYVMLKIAGKDVQASKVMASWKKLFPEGTAPEFANVEPDIQARFLDSFVAEQVLLQQAEEDKLAEKPEVKALLKEAHDQLLVRLLLKEKAADEVSEDAIRIAYDRYVQSRSNRQEIRVRHVLTHTEDEARSAYDALADGKDFSEIAKQYSKDPVTAESAGDLGYLVASDMVKAFADAAFALKEGVVSTPVKTDLGWHIIRVDDVREATILPYHEMRPKLVDNLQKKLLDRYMATLVKQAGVLVSDAKGESVELEKLHDDSPKTLAF